MAVQDGMVVALVAPLGAARNKRARPRPSPLAWLLLAEAAVALAAAALVILVAPRPPLPSAEGPALVMPFIAGADLPKAALPEPAGVAAASPTQAGDETAADAEEVLLDAAGIAAAQERIAAALAIARLHLDAAARQATSEAPPPALPLLDEPPGLLALAEPPELPADLPAVAAAQLPAAPLPLLDEPPDMLDLPEPPLAEPALAALADPPELLPQAAAATPRIVIHHPARTDAALRRAQALAATLPGAEIRAVRASPATPGVRFFFAADRDAAQALARVVRASAGAQVAVADFSHFRPLPRPGTLEIWLPHP